MTDVIDKVNEKTMGMIAFQAYCKFTGGKTFQKKPIPPWADISEHIQQAWTAAAQAVVNVTLGVDEPETDDDKKGG